MKPELTTQQKRVIRRTLDRIEAHADTFAMETYVGTDDRCGTTCCFAGHLALAVTKRPLDAMPEDERSSLFWTERINDRHVCDIASEFLGGGDVPSRLFLTSGWPTRFRLAYWARKTKPAKARVLRRRVEHWMETGE